MNFLAKLEYFEFFPSQNFKLKKCEVEIISDLQFTPTVYNEFMQEEDL